MAKNNQWNLVIVILQRSRSTAGTKTAGGSDRKTGLSAL